MYHSKEFDIIAVTKSDMKRIKVTKTEAKAPSGSYLVNLRQGGGYSKSNATKKLFDKSEYELLLVDSPEGIYLIPSGSIKQTTCIYLSTYKEFLIAP